MNGKSTAKGEKSRTELLEAAITLLAERGNSENVTIRDIAALAKVTSSRLTYYFQTRTNLLSSVVEYLLTHKHPTPVAAFLENNRELLHTREGQVLFINNLFSSFRTFFLKLSAQNLRYCNAYRALLTSREIACDLSANPRFFLKDALAFYEIFRTITGKDDIELAHFWYSTTLDSFARRISNQKAPTQVDDARVFSANINMRFLYFCRRELLIGLGLWETPDGLPTGK